MHAYQRADMSPQHECPLCLPPWLAYYIQSQLRFHFYPLPPDWLDTLLLLGEIGTLRRDSFFKGVERMDELSKPKGMC